MQTHRSLTDGWSLNNLSLSFNLLRQSLNGHCTSEILDLEGRAHVNLGYTYSIPLQGQKETESVVKWFVYAMRKDQVLLKVLTLIK